MLPPVPPQDGLNAIVCSANKENSDEFIFANSFDSDLKTTEDPISFTQKHINDLIKYL